MADKRITGILLKCRRFDMQLVIKKIDRFCGLIICITIGQNQKHRVQHMLAFCYTRFCLNQIPCFQCLPGIVCQIGFYAKIAADIPEYLNKCENGKPMNIRGQSKDSNPVFLLWPRICRSYWSRAPNYPKLEIINFSSQFSSCIIYFHFKK